MTGSLSIQSSSSLGPATNPSTVTIICRMSLRSATTTRLLSAVHPRVRSECRRAERWLAKLSFCDEREETMIARIWTGAVRREDGDAYTDYMRATGIAGYEGTPGNRGAWMLRRDLEERTEFVMFTLWDSLDAVKAFAGEDYDRAVFYPEDDRYLIERDLRAKHYEVVSNRSGSYA